jgi:hypothetical protein
MAKVERFQQIFDSPKSLVIRAAIGVVLAYSLFTRAFDTGSLFQYSLVILILIICVRSLIRAVQISKNGK